LLIRCNPKSNHRTLVHADCGGPSRVGSVAEPECPNLVWTDLESDIAQLLYVYLDLIMADKQRYERRTKELFDDVGLEGTEYRKPSVRKRLLQRALDELWGLTLSTGVISYARLERTKDRKDYKVIFRKAPLPLEHYVSASNGEQATHDAALTSQAAQLIRYFHQRFHPAEEVTIASRELKTALELISKHGDDRVRFLVDYAYQRAPETNYRPKYFSGIRSYGTRAMAAYDEMEELKAAEAAIAACECCDDGSWIHFREPNGHVFSAYCPHDAHMIEARMQCEGLTRLL
jgi:hypothetical protein